jgi:hypothetical protein
MSENRTNQQHTESDSLKVKQEKRALWDQAQAAVGVAKTELQAAQKVFDEQIQPMKDALQKRRDELVEATPKPNGQWWTVSVNATEIQKRYGHTSEEVEVFAETEEKAKAEAELMAEPDFDGAREIDDTEGEVEAEEGVESEEEHTDKETEEAITDIILATVQASPEYKQALAEYEKSIAAFQAALSEPTAKLENLQQRERDAQNAYNSAKWQHDAATKSKAANS